MNKSPAYQWYVKDYLSSMDCRRMTYEEKGVYRELLDISWDADPQCFLPNNPAELADFLGISQKKFQKIWEKLRKKFAVTEDGEKLFNERLLRELRKQESKREHLADNGRLGGRPKKQKPSKRKAIEKQLVSDKKPIDNQKKSLAVAVADAIADAEQKPPSERQPDKPVVADKKPPKESKQSDPRWTPLLLHMKDEYERVNPGVEFKADFDKTDAVQVRAMLKKCPGYTLDTLKTAWSSFMCSDEEFHQKKRTGHPARYWCSNINHFVKLSQPKAVPVQTPQPLTEVDKANIEWAEREKAKRAKR